MAKVRKLGYLRLKIGNDIPVCPVTIQLDSAVQFAAKSKPKHLHSSKQASGIEIHPTIT